MDHLEKNIVISIKNPSKPLQRNTFPNRLFTVIKLVIVCLVALGICFNSNNNLTILNINNISCIYDNGFQFTKQLNQLLIDIPLLRNILLSAGSLLLDCIFVFSFFHWALNNHSCQYLLTLVAFYVSRGIIQRIFAMPFPTGYCWEDPHFPSLVVDYFRTNDFFFSGHVGMPLITGLNFRKLKNNSLAYVCYFSVIYEGILVLVTRVHYSIDIIVGIVFSQYCFIVIDYWFKYFNKRNAKKETNTIKQQELSKNVIKLKIQLRRGNRLFSDTVSLH